MDILPEAFRKLAQIPWMDNPNARAAGYYFRALAFRPTPSNILNFGAATLELIQREVCPTARLALIITMDRTLYSFQKSYPDTLLSIDYENLMLAIDHSSSEITPAMINLGLDAAFREVTPSSQDYFNWVTERITNAAHDFPNGQKLSYQLTTLSKLGELTKKHPSLITPEYVEMCCHFIALPFLTPPRIKSHEQPHEITKRKRLSAEIEATNNAVESAHVRAGSNLSSVITQITSGRISTSITELFSDQSLHTLEEATHNKNQGHINAVVVPTMLKEIKLLRHSAKPPLRLTYDGPKAQK